MKWIILAGPSDTRKTWTLTEVVIALVNTRGATLVSPETLPTQHPAETPDKWPYYDDGTYELVYNGRRIMVKTDGDTPGIVNEGFESAQKHKADFLISATRARSCSGHIAIIDDKVLSGSAEVFMIAALYDNRRAMSEIVKWRIQQIIDML